MDLLSWLALIFLTLSGFSAGAVLGRQTRTGGHRDNLSPSLLDTIMVVVLWVGGITSRLGGLEAWSAVGLWLGVAVAVAFILNRLQSQPDEGKSLAQ
jgi:hypothetical protein